MPTRPDALSRRHFLLASAVPLIGAAGGWALELPPTPKQTEGPFYPNKLPLDTDNDLLMLNDSPDPALGEVTHLTGRVLDSDGSPLKNAVVEIWQCDANGAYLHTGTVNKSKRDPHFQGFGRFVTGPTGDYYFRTIKPVNYPGRTPHIHVKVKRAGRELLTTQCYIEGHPQNARDGVLRSIKDEKARASVQVPFTPLKDSPKELAAHFVMVLGKTPEAD